MIWPFKKSKVTDLNQASVVLDPFVSQTVTGMAEVEADTARSQQLTVCYVYGAIRYLVSYDEMDPGSCDALMQTQLVKHFQADDAEIEEYLVFIKVAKPSGNEQLFMIEGASALRRWLVNNDQSTGENLSGLLKISLSREGKGSNNFL